MSADRSQLDLLKAAAGGLVTVARAEGAGSPGEEEPAAEPECPETVGLAFDFREGSAKGFSGEGAEALVRLARSLRNNSEELVRGVALNALCGVVAKEIMAIFRGRSGGDANAEDLRNLRAGIKTWFDGAAATRRHLIPCAILPSTARAFEIGPVRFFHRSELDPKDYGLGAVKDGVEVYFGPLLRMMDDHAAGWLAEVSVDRRERGRSGEIAGLTVDVALGGLQLVVPPCYSRHMARISGRAMPSYRGSFAVTDTGVEPGIANLQPGLGLPADKFEAFIAAASAEFAAMGRLIDAYLSGRGRLPNLQEAWCNAVYWFHEGMCEPLDAVAIVKLETAIENLIRTDGRKGSKTRILVGLKGMFGVSESDTIAPTSDVTFEKLVEKIVQARSMVLHGNRPTLPGREQGIDRWTLELIARQFLIGYPGLLERFENEADTVLDDGEALLNWAGELAGAAKASTNGGS